MADMLIKYPVKYEERGQKMEEIKVNPVACWSLSLDIECPKCKSYLDLIEHPDFWDGRPDSFSVLHSKNEDATCPECGHEFVCDFQY